MTEPLIPGGCILLARRVIESEIWAKPPLYFKVWAFLLASAQHSDYKSLRRGQLSISMPDIREAVKWKVGARTERPKIEQIYQIIDWLRKPNGGGNEAKSKATMITTTKATQCLLITIDNYGFYQTLANYESNAESSDEKPAKPTRRESQPRNINKNVNNDNKKDIKTPSRQPKTYAEDDPYYRMAAYFYNRLQTFVNKIGKGHLIQDSNMQIWADDFRKIIELDKRPRKELGEVVNWATSDPFWQQNILSPDKLRKKYVDLCLKMASNSGPGSNSNDKLFEKNKIEAQKIMEAMEREGIGNKDIILKN